MFKLVFIKKLVEVLSKFLGLIIILDINKDFVILFWWLLESDGGFLFIEYVIEKCDIKRNIWVLVIKVFVNKIFCVVDKF